MPVKNGAWKKFNRVVILEGSYILKTINKSIYFYWGNDTISYMRFMTLYSFKFYNPTWTIYLIKNNQDNKRILKGTVEKQDKTEYIGKDYSYLLDTLDIIIIEFDNKMIDLDDSIVSVMSDVHIKDILNWKLLSEQGGVVADMDILFTAPISKSITHHADIGLVCFDGNPQKDYIPVSFMYSSGNNIFFNKIYKNALVNYKDNVYESCGTNCIYEKNLNRISDAYPNIIIQKLNDSIVFPFIAYPWLEGINMLYEKDNTNLMHYESIGIHWYGGAPQSQKYNNILNDRTVHEINNTISVNIRRIL